MGKVNAAVLAFNRGTISKRALGRVDIDRIQYSAEDQTNFIPSKLGSMMLRPGFGYLLNSDSDLPYYLPFVFAVDDSALIELTDGVAKVIVDDARLTYPAVTTAITNGTLAANIAGWTDADEAGAVGVFAASAGGAVVALTSRTVYDYATGATATAKFKLDNDGSAYTKRVVQDANTYQAVAGEWKFSGAVADYEHRATLASGTLTSGTTGSWLGGGTDREWVRAQTSVGTSTAVLTVETRLVGTTVTLATATITLQATWTASGGRAGGSGGGGLLP